MEARVSKAIIRAQITAASRRFGTRRRASGARLITQRVMSLPVFQQANCIGLYAAIEDEVATSEICAAALRAQKQICYPRVISRHQRRMDFFAISSHTELVPGYHDIPEPRLACRAVLPQTIDCVCVPGVAFDLAGHRLGRGAGYYDRWLADYSGIRIGLAFECQLVERLPAAFLDQGVHYIITEQRILRQGH